MALEDEHGEVEADLGGHLFMFSVPRGDRFRRELMGVLETGALFPLVQVTLLIWDLESLV